MHTYICDFWKKWADYKNRLLKRLHGWYAFIHAPLFERHNNILSFVLCQKRIVRATRSRTLNFLITYAESDASLSLWPCCIYLFTQKVSSTKYFRCAHLFRAQWIYARECDTRLSFGHPSIRESYATAWCLFLRGERVSNIILICAVMT